MYRQLFWYMTIATISGDAGLCASREVGVFAALIVVSSSSRQTGQTRVSWRYLTRSTFAGVILSSSRTVLYPRCSIGASQSRQKRSDSGTSHLISRMGSKAYRSSRTDFFFLVRVCSLTTTVSSGSVPCADRSTDLSFFTFSLEVPKNFLLNSSRVSFRFAMVLLRSVTVLRSSPTVARRSEIVWSFSFRRSSWSAFVFISSWIISSGFTGIGFICPFLSYLYYKGKERWPQTSRIFTSSL